MKTKANLFFAVIVLAVVTQACVARKLIPVTKRTIDNYQLEYGWLKHTQYFSGPDSIILKRQVDSLTKKVEKGVLVLENGTLIHKIIIPPYTKGEMMDYDSIRETIAISFDNSDTANNLFYFKPITPNSKNKYATDYFLQTKENNRLWYDHNLFSVTPSRSYLYWDERKLKSIKINTKVLKGREVK